MNPKNFEKQFFAVDRHFHFNCLQLRECVRQIIEDRKNTKKDDTNDFGGDVISLLLQDESYQDTEAIIDDIIVMFLAGSKTV